MYLDTCMAWGEWLHVCMGMHACVPTTVQAEARVQQKGVVLEIELTLSSLMTGAFICWAMLLSQSFPDVNTDVAH